MTTNEKHGKIKCWEFIKCGRDEREDCPAYPNKGRNCWVVAGTWCIAGAQSKRARKIKNCVDCEFYKFVEKELEREQKKMLE